MLECTGLNLITRGYSDSSRSSSNNNSNNSSSSNSNNNNNNINNIDYDYDDYYEDGDHYDCNGETSWVDVSDEESSDESVAQEINNESSSENNDIIIECVENVSDHPNTKLHEFNNLFHNLEESRSRKYSKSLFSLATKHGVSRAFYDEFIKDINSYNE
ncbi:hypothetical protein INT45_002656, partial [Circinella minor]